MALKFFALLTLAAYANACGEVKVPRGGNRIVGGDESTEHAWPWQVSLQAKGGWLQPSFSHICGGTIIDREWVVTAAHCVDGSSANSLRIVASEHHRGTNSGREQTINIARIAMHGSYDGNANGFPNDIALLRLSSPIVFNDYTQPACLPAEGDEFVGAECWITGWGNTAGTGDNNVLRELRINVVSNNDCDRAWGSGYINDRHICVGNGDKGACNGDSGGPLVCKKNNRWVVAGATSWGRSGCQTEGYPNVYTRISKFLDWVNGHMGSK